jgi:dUTP pyrophosphatase
VPDIPIVRLDPDLALPAYAKPGDAGIDLLAAAGVTLRAGGGRALVATGIAIALPADHSGWLLARSGLALHHGITLLNAPGLIDAGYRDEIKVLMVNTDPAADYQIHRGDRIAQLVVLPVQAITWRVVERLDGDNRGGGFGHTGYR